MQYRRALLIIAGSMILSTALTFELFADIEGYTYKLKTTVEFEEIGKAKGSRDGKKIAKCGWKFKVIRVKNGEIIVKFKDGITNDNITNGSRYKIAKSNLLHICGDLCSKKEDEELLDKEFILKQTTTFLDLDDDKIKALPIWKCKIYAYDKNFYYIEFKENKEASQYVQDGQHYKIDEKSFDLEASTDFRGGINVSTLYLPFKFRFYSKDRSTPPQITPGVNINFSLGYTFYHLTGLVFSGLGTISTSDINDSESNTNMLMGLSFGGGIAYSINRKFQVFLVSGVDKLGGNNGRKWDFEWMPWLSFGIGYHIFDL